MSVGGNLGGGVSPAAAAAVRGLALATLLAKAFAAAQDDGQSKKPDRPFKKRFQKLATTTRPVFLSDDDMDYFQTQMSKRPLKLAKNFEALVRMAEDKEVGSVAKLLPAFTQKLESVYYGKSNKPELWTTFRTEVAHINRRILHRLAVNPDLFGDADVPMAEAPPRTLNTWRAAAFPDARRRGHLTSAREGRARLGR